MLKQFVVAACFSVISVTSAQAAVIDFANEADTNGERGLPTAGGMLTIDGVDMLLTASGPGGAQHAYLDSTSPKGPAGLGSCSFIDAGLQCDPPSDDNVQAGESVTIEFVSDRYYITDLTFRDDDHQLITDGEVTITTDHGTLTDMFSAFIAMAISGDAFFAAVSSITFTNAGSNFYVSGLEVSDIPIPGAFPLLLSGLVGFGFAARRKKGRN